MLALSPANSGYIHPDEHFQSVEVTRLSFSPHPPLLPTLR